MTSLDSILKSRDVTLPTKVRLVKAMVFPVVMYGCESWTIKKAEHRRIDAFVLWCWRRLLRVPWTARRSNQSILREISPEYAVEGLVLKLKLQYFGHLIWRTDSWQNALHFKRTEIQSLTNKCRLLSQKQIRTLVKCLKKKVWGIVVQLLSHVWLFVNPWTAANQAFLFFIISWNLLKLMSVESMTPSNHLILCRPLLLLPSMFPSIRVFFNE